MDYSLPFLYQKIACSPSVDKNFMEESIEQAIKNDGLETEIKNIVFHHLRDRHLHETKTNGVRIQFVVLSKSISFYCFVFRATD